MHNVIANLFIRIFKFLRKVSPEYRELSASRSQLAPRKEFDISIVICTFEDRYFTFALPLIKQIRNELDFPIILISNGNLDKPVDTVKHSAFLKEVLQFKNVFPVSFLSFQGCAKMWNTGILHSDTEIVFVLNDDIQLMPGNLEKDFLAAIKNTREGSVTRINGSWSHFVVSKEAIRALGWFDERFVGIGEEDGDFQDRYRQTFSREIPTTRLISFVNLIDKSRDENVAKVSGKYSLFNSVLVQHKRFKALSVQEAKALYPFWSWRQNHLGDLKITTTESIERNLEVDL